MLQLLVPDLSCGHCMNVIRRAVETVDRAALVEFDLPAQRVSIDSTADALELAAAIEDAGYPVSDLERAKAEPASCCGSCTA